MKKFNFLRMLFNKIKIFLNFCIPFQIWDKSVDWFCRGRVALVLLIRTAMYMQETDRIISKSWITALIVNTAGIGRMGLFSARLVHFFLCSIYGVKNELQKNMPQLWRYVLSSLVPLQPKAIKYGLTFRMWTIRNVSKLCQNSITFLLNFQFEKKVP